MKFIVQRTSMCNNKKPCEEAYENHIDKIEEWKINSFEEYNKRFGEYGLWESEGLNHKINSNGYIQRTFPNAEKVWFIDINSLDELINFNNKYGSIVIENYYNNTDYKCIEIYDACRE